MIQNVKRVTTFLFSFLCLILTACVSDPASYYFDYGELKDKVMKVELINYENPDVEIVKRKTDVLQFDFNKMQIVEVLDAEKHESFFQELSEIHFHIADALTKYINSAAGLSIRIIYQSGDFVVIGSNQNSDFLGEFKDDGSVGELIGYIIDDQDFETVVSGFFVTYFQ